MNVALEISLSSWIFILIFVNKKCHNLDNNLPMNHLQGLVAVENLYLEHYFEFKIIGLNYFLNQKVDSKRIMDIHQVLYGFVLLEIVHRLDYKQNQSTFGMMSLLIKLVFHLIFLPVIID